MEKKRLFIVSIVLVVLGLTVTCTVGFTIFNSVKITKLTCDFNPEWVQNGTCKLKAISRYRHEASVKGFLKKPMYNFWVHMKTFKFYNVYRPFIISYKINLCKYYRKNAKIDFILASAIEVAQDFTNLNHSCPYEGWIVLEKGLYMRNYSHILIPAGKYKAEIKVEDGVDKNPVLRRQIYIDVVEDTEE